MRATRKAVASLLLLGVATGLPAQGTVTAHGASCPAAANLATGFAPNPGAGALALYEHAAIPNAPAVACIGASRTQWGSLPLPLDLAVLGLPACAVHASLDVVLPVTTRATGLAEVFLPVPAAGALAGARVQAQWINLADPRVSTTLPWTTSNGLECTFGARVGMPGFVITGDPRSFRGATWTYRSTDHGIAYDLAGVLFAPAAPPDPNRACPAVVISHGNGGNAATYSARIARQMVQWGLVCIATNLTHAGNVPIGAPGTAAERGASAANALRIAKCVDLLQSLGNVDVRRVAAHGNSMGAFATGAVLGLHPDRFLVASHTAGGLSDQPNSAATSTAQARAIRTPYQLHHGDQDRTVPLLLDQLLANVLASNPTVHELRVYPGYGHADISDDPTMLANVRMWYAAQGLW